MEHTCHAGCPCHTGGTPTPDFYGPEPRFVIPEPPEGYEVIPESIDEAVEPLGVQFRAPDGEVVSLEELMLAGLVE